MLELRDVSLSFGGQRVLARCDLRLFAGERIALMGPSGCGKTSLLRVALGLQKPDSGTVRRGTASVAAVFQESRLLPWRTAEENVNLVLSDRDETMPEARAWLARLELGDACGHYPAALSGGMQQRVSIARALAARPALLILDEPFKGLDEALRRRVMRTVSDSADSILLATHSEEEAQALGCRILRYKDGRWDY